MRPLSISLRKSLAEQVAQHEENVDDALDYLLARGIDRATALKFRLGVVSDPSSEYQGRLAVPSLGFDGHPYNIRFRTMNDQTPKYLGMPGFETRLFNVRAIREADDEIHITEGELDAVVLDQCGLSAVGVCGANSWKRHHPRMFSGFTRVYVWGDGDKAGGEFARKVYDSMTSVTMIKMKSGMDVTDLFLAEGQDGIKKAMGIDE